MCYFVLQLNFNTLGLLWMFICSFSFYNEPSYKIYRKRDLYLSDFSIDPGFEVNTCRTYRTKFKKVAITNSNNIHFACIP